MGVVLEKVSFDWDMLVGWVVGEGSGVLCFQRSFQRKFELLRCVNIFSQISPTFHEEHTRQKLRHPSIFLYSFPLVSPLLRCTGH